MNLIERLFDTRFMAHVYCYRQDAALVGLHFWSDLSIGAAYVAISLTLVYLVRRAKSEIPFSWMFLCFGAFIIACGGTHFMEVLTLRTPVYWLSGVVKALTAVASVATAFALPPLVPRSLDLVRAANLSEQRRLKIEQTNRALEREIEERKRAEEEVLRLNADLERRVEKRTAELARANRSLRELAAIVESSHDAIYGRTLDGIITHWNPAAERTYGYSAAEIIGQPAALLIPVSLKGEFAKNLDRIRNGEIIEPFETINLRKTGEGLDAYITISPTRDEMGAIIGAGVIARDITERKRTEAALRETQKLESLGLIAGGVAHDFNNLLVAILGNASLVLEDTPARHPNSALLRQVVSASEKAALLTGQLLAYAGKGRFVVEKINVSDLVRDMSTLISTSISKLVELQLDLASDLPVVEADRGQLQQLVMNLVLNGAEAIPQGRAGKVLVATGVQQVEPEQASQPGDPVEPGQYVSLEVRDDGTGMPAEVMARMFDPFFTTKFTGRGLGLSAAQGIVRSHNGTIRVRSESGKGTMFQILLPATSGTASVPPDADSDSLQGEGTILVIDDEEIVRATVRSTLEHYGYQVIVARDGLEGIEEFRKRSPSIAVVLLDMTMPLLSGEETLRRIQGIRPDTLVVLSSGYNEVEAVRRFTGTGIAAFVQKPYLASSLARVIQRVTRIRRNL